MQFSLHGSALHAGRYILQDVLLSTGNCTMEYSGQYILLSARINWFAHNQLIISLIPFLYDSMSLYDDNFST